MANIHKGRYSAEIDGEFVVFIIGMRVNRLWAIHKWLPVFTSMGPMIKELYMNPDTGFLGTEYFMSWRGVTLLQYWRSYDELEKYARGGLHLEAWKRFNQSVEAWGYIMKRTKLNPVHMRPYMRICPNSDWLKCLTMFQRQAGKKRPDVEWVERMIQQ